MLKPFEQAEGMKHVSEENLSEPANAPQYLIIFLLILTSSVSPMSVCVDFNPSAIPVVSSVKACKILYVLVFVKVRIKVR